MLIFLSRVVTARMNRGLVGLFSVHGTPLDPDFIALMRFAWPGPNVRKRNSAKTHRIFISWVWTKSIRGEGIMAQLSRRMQAYFRA